MVSNFYLSRGYGDHDKSNFIVFHKVSCKMATVFIVAFITSGTSTRNCITKMVNINIAVESFHQLMPELTLPMQPSFLDGKGH